jgi:translation initiation factor 1
MANQSNSSKSGSSKAGGGRGDSAKADRTVYSEFGHTSNADAFTRGIPDLPPNQQNLRIQATRKGKGGKTVTVITGFQAQPEVLADLLKKLKSQCGSGGTVRDNELEIQGDHKQKLLEILVTLGYKAKISGG